MTLHSGPVIDLVIGVSSARAKALQASGMAIPQVQSVRALIDTGASSTCIDPSVMIALDLQPTGTVPMLTPSTGSIPVDAETYDVSLMIPAGTQTPLLVQNMPVSACVLFHGQGIYALLGRDVLSRCLLTYNGDINVFTIAY